ncbi:MAG: peptidoglycan DD-metalloendopeptidase family protein [Candidatus Wallacebacter cryptica]|jgi:murein DD-endopeptidase MepM/ murein hydrolase activator NlpD|nr:peptidoglycan DD-metalloendopeptidase family protein [Bacillota bacterium]
MRRLIVLLLVVFTAFTGMAAAADGDNPTVIRESYVESKAQIEKMQAELAELETKVEQTARELDQQQKQYDAFKTEQAEILEAINQAAAERADLEEKLAARGKSAEIHSRRSQEQLAKLSRSADSALRKGQPVNPNAGLFLDYLLYKSAEEYRAAADTHKTEQRKNQQGQKQLTALMAEQAELQARLSRLEAELKSAGSELSDKKKDNAAIRQQISELTRKIYREESRAWQLEKQVRDSVGFSEFVWPLDEKGVVSSDYGMRFHPIYEEERFHTGIDLAVNAGVPIRAAADGTVVLSEDANGYGLTVVIDHGEGLSTLYAHASKLLVKPGDIVRAGDAVALVGSTGFSTGPHLHFEVRQHQEHVDPWIWLS